MIATDSPAKQVSPGLERAVSDYLNVSRNACNPSMYWLTSDYLKAEELAWNKLQEELDKAGQSS